MSDSFELFIAGNFALLDRKSFEQYLTDGNNKNFQTPLSESSDDDFLILEKIVNEWNSFQIGFEAFYSERVRRFDCYG